MYSCAAALKRPPPSLRILFVAIQTLWLVFRLSRPPRWPYRPFVLCLGLGLQNSYRIFPELLQNSFKYISVFFQNFSRIPSEFLQNSFRILQEFVQNSPRFFSEFFQNSPRILSDFLQIYLKTLSEFFHNFFRIPLSYRSYHVVSFSLTSRLYF